MANGLFGGGNGTQGNPYIVEDVADILAINSHNNSASNVLYYSQNQNISGSFSNINVGNYNGNFFTIDFRNESTDNSPFIKNWGELTNLYIENLNVNPTIASHIGGLVSESKNKISKVSVTGTIKPCNDCIVGGLVGLLYTETYGMVNDDIVDCKAYITYDGSASTTSQIYGLVGEHKPGWDIGASAYDNNSVSRCIAKMIATGTFAKIGGLAGDAPSNLNNLNTSFKENVVECDINAIANEFVGLVYNYGEVRNNYVKGSVSGYIGKFSGLLNHYNNAWQNSVLKNYSAITYQNSYPSHISYPLIAEDMGSYPDTLSFYDSSKYGLPSNCPSARTTEQMITQSTYELFNHYKFTVSKTNIQNVTQDNVYFEYWQVSLYSGLSLVGSFVYIVKTILDTNYIDHNPDPLAGALFIDRGLRGVGKPDNFVFIGINGVWQQTSFDSALNSLLPSGRDGDLIDDIDLFTIYRVDGGNGKYTSKLKCYHGTDKWYVFNVIVQNDIGDSAIAVWPPQEVFNGSYVFSEYIPGDGTTRTWYGYNGAWIIPKIISDSTQVGTMFNGDVYVDAVNRLSYYKEAGELKLLKSINFVSPFGDLRYGQNDLIAYYINAVTNIYGFYYTMAENMLRYKSNRFDGTNYIIEWKEFIGIADISEDGAYVGNLFNLYDIWGISLYINDGYPYLINVQYEANNGYLRVQSLNKIISIKLPTTGQIGIQSLDKIVRAKLVNIGDANASPIRIMTNTGIKAISY